MQESYRTGGRFAEPGPHKSPPYAMVLVLARGHRFYSMSIWLNPQRAFPFTHMLVWLLLCMACVGSPALACTFDHHCLATCDGTKVVPRGCTPDYRCESIPAFARDCAADSPPLEFKIGDSEHRVPQTCLLTANSAECGPDKSSATTLLTVDCIRVSEAFAEVSTYRENLERVRVESAAVCRDHIEDTVIEFGVNVAFMAALFTADKWRDVAIALTGIASDKVLSSAINGRFAQQASDGLREWAERFGNGKPTAADYCGFQEELRDVTIPALDTIVQRLNGESRTCRERRDIFDAFPEPVDRPPEIDLEPREPDRPEPPAPPPPAAPPPPGYVAACPCDGAGLERVPVLVGSTLADAAIALARCNLVGRVGSSRYSNRLPEGRVLEQTRAAGVCLPPASPVTMVSSLGANRRTGLWIEPANTQMAVGETLKFDAHVGYLDGSQQSFSYGASWVAEIDGRQVSMKINAFTPTTPGTYRISAVFESLSASTTVVVSPSRVTLGRGNWNVYCTFEGQVVAIEGYSTGTMEGPFRTQQDADGWIGVHCPSRSCDRAFTCIETVSSDATDAASENAEGWTQLPPGRVTDQPVALAGGGWEEMQGGVVDASDDACGGSEVSDGFARADAAASANALSDWANAIATIMASGCRNERLRDSVLAATDAVRRQEAREQKIATLVRQQRPDFDYGNLLRVLTQTLSAVEQARSTSPVSAGSSLPGAGGTMGRTPGTPSSGSSPASTGSSNTACQQATARLRANSDAQRRAAAGSAEASRLQQQARSLRAQMCSACGVQGGFCQ